MLQLLQCAFLPPKCVPQNRSLTRDINYRFFAKQTLSSVCRECHTCHSCHLGCRDGRNRHATVGADTEFGGDEEDRTPDLRIANATLSQLSYVPELDTLSKDAEYSKVPACLPQRL